MHRLLIQNLGPISQCELICSQFMTLTGAQASGKSTIAKSIFFFRTVKNDIYEVFEQDALSRRDAAGTKTATGLGRPEFLLRKRLEDKFVGVFGSCQEMERDMRLEYRFSESCWVRVSLENGLPTPSWSQSITDFLTDRKHELPADLLGTEMTYKRELLHRNLQTLFEDPYETLYIPAGRSMLTLLSQQWGYIYATMSDVQKRSIDYCTQSYIKTTLRLKSEFSNGLEGLYSTAVAKAPERRQALTYALDLTRRFLDGSFNTSRDEEQITLSNGRSVQINFASSGQQEAVWISNLLVYYLSGSVPAFFIIEEPESHLFPESQKYMTELISLAHHEGHSLLLTTHSPYVLGTLNNLLYAAEVGRERQVEASEIIPREYWIEPSQFNAWFVSQGKAECCMDSELHLIQNERIDEISNVINRDYDRLFLISHTEEEGE